MRAVPAGYWRNLAAAGVPAGVIDRVRELWASDLETADKFGEIRALAEAQATSMARWRARSTS